MAREEEIVVDEAIPVEEEIVEPIAEEEEAITTKISQTSDEVPELAGKEIGDMVSLRITGISDDGKNFDLEVVPEEITEIEPTEEVGVMPAAGREAVVEALL